MNQGLRSYIGRSHNVQSVVTARALCLILIAVFLPLGAFAQFSSSNQVYIVNGGVTNWDDDFVFNYPFCQLVVSNAGVLNNFRGYIGYSSSASNDLAMVSGNGSLWFNNGNLYVGNNGASNQLVIAGGGVVYDTPNGYLGFSATSISNTVLVTGTGSVWSNSGAVYIGNSGASNQLTVSSNASIVANNLYIGFNASSVSNNLIISDGAVYVIGNGALDIRRGGLTLNSGTVTVDGLILNTGSSGTIAFNGGVLSTKATTASNGVPFVVGTITNAATLIVSGGTHTFADGLDIRKGTFRINSGTVTANQLTLTNGTDSAIFFSGGQLNTRSTTINDGAPFVVGSGTNAATLNLMGGVHTFAAGLVITNSATLMGTGTIYTNVTLLGALSPGASTGTITISGNLVARPSASLNFDLGTNSDLVTVNGNLTLDGTLNVTNSGGFTNTTYTLFTYGGTLTTNGSPTVLSLGAVPSTNFTYTVDITTAGQVKLVVAGVVSDPFAVWQNQYFGCTGCAQAQGDADPDADGMSNTNEFLAGFDPTNNAAYLHIISIVKTNNDMQVTYLGANGTSTIASRTNVLEFTTGTANGSYTNDFASTGQTNILSGGTGLGVVTNMVDVGGGTNTPSRFYRVRVLVP
ncbi:MAG TPA: hypothetical protein VL171_18500 [Verrucomicrobiae bacterium]|nr:hypothetical protein [Verrucomicrobiae bacterium]